MLHRSITGACVVNNMLAIYLKYHKAGLTPTTPVTSTAISSVKMSIGRKSLTNLTMDTYVAAKGKVGHVTSSAFRSFSGFIIALRNIYEKFIFWRLVI
jgi:hypothetical protein